MPTLNEQEIEEELEAKPEDFIACNVCQKPLSQDEKIINARFVNEAMANGGDITIFPVCIKCNFDNLLLNSKMVRDKKLGLINEDKPAFFPSNKKLYDENLHQNSEEFKQLGTLHLENRTAAYFPSEQPQPKANALEGGILKNAPYALVTVDEKALESSKQKKGGSIADSGRAIMQGDQNRTIQLKHMIGEKMREEGQRFNEINSELNRLKSEKARSSECAQEELMFPLTTNQEYINQE